MREEFSFREGGDNIDSFLRMGQREREREGKNEEKLLEIFLDGCQKLRVMVRFLTHYIDERFTRRGIQWSDMEH